MSKTPEPDDLVILKFKPLPDGVPIGVRVRHLLKRALRDWRLKCVAASLPPEPAAETPRMPQDARSVAQATKRPPALDATPTVRQNRE
jgi:hypothetical protein